MRVPMSFVAAVIGSCVAVVACSSSKTNGTSASSGGASSGSAGASGTSGTPASAANCTSTCTKYLECKGVDASYQATCEQNCAAQGFTDAELDSYKQQDCSQMVTSIEAARPGKTSSSSSSSGTSGSDYKQSKECAFGECVRDGTYCVVLGSAPRDCPQACCD